MSSYGGRAFLCSWSGGKDCCLAFHRAVKSGAVPHSLVTMLREDGTRSRSHGLPIELYEAQARSLGTDLITRSTSWEGYREAFLEALREVRSEGVDLGVFGDIDLEEHREWIANVCEEVGIEPWLPLWKSERRALIDELLAEGYKAEIVAIRSDSLDSEYLGRELNVSLVNEIAMTGIDVSGEAGEYHTVVTDGPVFSKPVSISHGKRASKDGYEFLQVAFTP